MEPAARRARQVADMSAALGALAALPTELLQTEIMTKLDGISLGRLEAASTAFRGRVVSAERAAQEAVMRLNGGDARLAARFRHRSWKERLHIEHAAVGFDVEHATSRGFEFSAGPKGGSGGMPGACMLMGMGPKLLTSDLSTAGGRLLRWRLQVRGNTALEFGVVPEALARVSGSLHKQLAVPGDPTARPTGFASHITAGSTLPFRASVMRGSIVEVLAWRGRVEFLLLSEPMAREMHWVNGQAVARTYRGPAEMRLAQEFPTHYDVKLAMTCWAKGAFLVLHSPPPGALPAKQPPASDASAVSAPPGVPRPASAAGSSHLGASSGTAGPASFGGPPPADGLSDAGPSCPADAAAAGGTAPRQPHPVAAGGAQQQQQQEEAGGASWSHMLEPPPPQQPRQQEVAPPHYCAGGAGLEPAGLAMGLHLQQQHGLQEQQQLQGPNAPQLLALQQQHAAHLKALMQQQQSASAAYQQQLQQWLPAPQGQQAGGTEDMAIDEMPSAFSAPAAASTAPPPVRAPPLQHVAGSSPRPAASVPVSTPFTQSSINTAQGFGAVATAAATAALGNYHGAGATRAPHSRVQQLAAGSSGSPSTSACSAATPLLQPPRRSLD